MREDVEAVRRAFELWNARDYDAWKEMYRPDVVVTPPEGWPEAEEINDREAWLAQAMRLTDSWEEQRIEVDAHEPLEGRVLTRFRWVTRGKDSGIEFETEMACISTVEDGKIARQEYFASVAAAQESSGRAAGSGD